MSEAVCSGRTHLFFAPHGEQADAREEREALAGAVCATCPVMIECRDHARRHRELGFWGGENDEERSDLRRRLRPPVTRPPLRAPVAGMG